MFNLNPNEMHLKGDFAYVLDTFYLHTNSNDLYVSFRCRNDGIWENEFTEWMINNIKPGWKCLDIGSNIGYHTEVLSRLVGSTGKVWAFEPNKELIKNYEEARKLNSYENCADITVFPFALSNIDSESVLCVPSTNIGHATVASYDETEWAIFSFQNIETKRLDSFFNESVDFIKIDIEGHEPQAWEGFPESVKQCPLIVAELGKYHPIEFLRWIEDTYDMSLFNGEQVTVEHILNHPHYIDVVLRKKN